MPLQPTDAVFLSSASPDVATAAAVAAALRPRAGDDILRAGFDASMIVR